MILRLHETKGYARAIDISCGLSVTKPSVSVAMRNLRENGYITVDDDKHIHLTDAGTAIKCWQRTIFYIDKKQERLPFTYRTRH